MTVHATQRTAGAALFLVLTLYITPVIYVYLDRLEGRLYRVRRKVMGGAASPPAE